MTPAAKLEIIDDILESAIDAALAIGPDHRIVRVNSRCHAFFGLRPEELVNLPLTTVLPGGLDGVVLERNGSTVSKPSPEGLRGRPLACRRNGATFSVDVLGHEVQTDHGPHVVLAFRDLTARLALEEELHRARTRLENIQGIAHVGTWEWNVQTDRVSWSDEMYRIYGYRPQSIPLSFQKATERIAPEDVKRIAANVEKSFAKGKDHSMDPIDYRIKLPDGTERWLRGSAELFFDFEGQPARMVGTVQDITERSLAERQIADRARDLERSNQDLERFAYSASHDLQEPLRVVKGYLELMQRHILDHPDPKCNEFVGLAMDGTVRMQRLISDLLQYSRVGTRGAPMVLFPLEDALVEAIKNLRVAVNESGAEITHESLPTLLADRGQIVQVFQNLLANAIKFHGAEKPRIQVAARAKDKLWEIAIRDNGIGIDPRFIPRLFNIFQRLHGEEYPGTGIGLALCRRIIERHGGSIWVDSAPGQGSTFRFTLPREVAA